MSTSVACRNSTTCTSQKNSEYKMYYYRKYNLYLVRKSTICTIGCCMSTSVACRNSTTCT